jgi:hypothetical protein
MKPISAIALSGALGLCSVAALAQMQSPVDPQAQTQAQPAPMATEAPKPILIETSVDLTTEPGPPADLRAAREEAVNALHWAKTEGCRSDPSPRDCVQRAQSEYRDVMARLGGVR